MVGTAVGAAVQAVQLLILALFMVLTTVLSQPVIQVNGQFVKAPVPYESNVVVINNNS